MGIGQTRGWGAGIHPALPGCVQPGREGVGEFRGHLTPPPQPPPPKKKGFRHVFGLHIEFIWIWIPSFRLESHLLLTEVAHKLSLFIFLHIKNNQGFSTVSRGIFSPLVFKSIKADMILSVYI